ncbi:hypothetical protein WA026_023737 [Henosepilachna vigintioctopunctata]|uniref:Uncharacterized protein n=1 Tax=Henosepilachna vigintioctopunctata TaxID=420089 RepID=A0AAW1U513_9CUCU
MNNNLKYTGLHPDKASKVHTSYISFKNTNPIIKAMEKYLSQEDLNLVLYGYRRSEFSEEALIADYMRGDVPKHKIVKDEHYQFALDVTKNLFKPRKVYKPVSFPDLRYYPWTLPTSAEATYSNDEY